MTIKRLKLMTLVITTAFVAGILLLSMPAFAQDENPLKSEVNIAVHDPSTSLQELLSSDYR